MLQEAHVKLSASLGGMQVHLLLVTSSEGAQTERRPHAFKRGMSGAEGHNHILLVDNK